MHITMSIDETLGVFVDVVMQELNIQNRYANVKLYPSETPTGVSEVLFYNLCYENLVFFCTKRNKGII